MIPRDVPRQPRSVVEFSHMRARANEARALYRPIDDPDPVVGETVIVHPHAHHLIREGEDWQFRGFPIRRSEW